jgi:hypothetical protein
MSLPTPIAGETPAGYHVIEGQIPLGGTAWTVAERLMQLMKQSDWFKQIPQSNFHFDQRASMMPPYVLIVVDNMDMETFVGGERIDATVTVFIVRASGQKTDTKTAYEDVERIRQLVDLHPRFDDLKDVTSVDVTNAKVTMTEGASFFQTVTTIKILAKMHKRRL